jgi:hypothetical protein
MKQLLIALTAVLLLTISCRDRQRQATSADRQLAPMAGYPEGFMGCSCTFSRNLDIDDNVS